MFLSSLMLLRCENFQKKKKTLIFPVWNLLPKPCKQKETYILPLEKDLKTLKEMITGTVGTEPLSHLQFFKVGKIVAGEI